MVEATTTTTPTTVTTEAPTVTSAPSPSPAQGESFDVDLDSDLDSIVVEDPGAAVAAPSGPQAQEAPKVAQASLPATVAAPAVPAPAVAEPTVQAPPAASAEAPTINTPEDFLSAWEAGREALVERIATEQFALSEEELAALETAPGTVLPRLLAKGLFTAVSSAQRLLMEQLPLMIASYSQKTSAQKSAQERFYAKFPHLRDPEHFATVKRFADVYKQSFPGMPLEQRIEEIGRLATQHLGLAGTTSAASAPASVAAQPQVVARQVMSHLPAAAAGGASAGSMLATDDPFAGALRDWGD